MIKSHLDRLFLTIATSITFAISSFTFSHPAHAFAPAAAAAAPEVAVGMMLSLSAMIGLVLYLNANNQEAVLNEELENYLIDAKSGLDQQAHALQKAINSGVHSAIEASLQASRVSYVDALAAFNLAKNYLVKNDFAQTGGWRGPRGATRSDAYVDKVKERISNRRQWANLTCDDLRKLLEAAGYTLDRTKSSHEQWVKAGQPTKTLACHDNKNPDKNLIRQIARIVGLLG